MRMRFTLFWIFAGALALAQDIRTAEPAGQLYETGIRLVEERSYDAARETFQTLIHRYPDDALATEAQYTIDATLLFEEGEHRVRAAKYDTARLTFETLVEVYPETALAEQAREELRAVEEMELAQTNARIVRSIRFEIKPVTAKEIQDRFNEREVGLALERPFDSRDAEEARTVLTELLIEKGMPHPHVKVETRTLRQRSFEVKFTLSKR